LNQLSLKKKIILLILGISLISPIISGVIIYKNHSTIEEYQIIADRSLPRTREMGEVLFNFRQVRIQFRSLVIRDNTPKDTDIYLGRINDSVKALTEDLGHLVNMMSTNPEERKMSEEVKAGWKEFEAFGDQLLALQKKGDEASYREMAELVRYTCPKKSEKFETAVQAMIKWQEEKAIWRTAKAKENTIFTDRLSIGLALLGVIISLTVGFIFTSSLVKSLTISVSDLKSGADEISTKSDDVADIAIKLSEAAVEQSSSIQETVSSIDEISAMVSRNSDSAQGSLNASEVSTRAAQKGKENVELMIDSINSITMTNQEIIDQMNSSNLEISQIVNVINNISEKTQVINDIVFQTKLLSFNASVEAARAGEHGKGFAVVAEEVGNLASMSGKAATEITDMLSSSVNKVTEIVEKSKTLMDVLIKKSKQKVELGSTTAQDCARSLDDILRSVSSVNNMVHEIAVASKEQSVGVGEVNKAMSQLDEVTQANTLSSQASSDAATDLKMQVERLNGVVEQLLLVVEGRGNLSANSENKRSPNVKNVIELATRNNKKSASHVSKRAVGMNTSIPQSDDPNFEDV
jgi:methyl-accepting chemotaxis protein